MRSSGSASGSSEAETFRADFLKRLDFLRAVAESVLQLLMEADVEGLVGAGRHERAADRLNWRRYHVVPSGPWAVGGG